MYGSLSSFNIVEFEPMSCNGHVTKAIFTLLVLIYKTACAYNYLYAVLFN